MGSSTERMRRLRARRAAERLAAAPDPPRAPDELLVPAVQTAIGALQLTAADAAIAQAALMQARIIDTAPNAFSALRWHGPLLLDALTALGATPMSRAKLPAPVPPDPPSGLDELRRARAQRHWPP